MSYKSPIELLITDIQHQVTEKCEEACYEAVLHYIPNVDRAELLKALEYDRGQYEKGYRDAKNEIVRCEDCWKWYPYNNGGSHDCPYCGYPDADFYCGEGDRRKVE